MSERRIAMLCFRVVGMVVLLQAVAHAPELVNLAGRAIDLLMTGSLVTGLLYGTGAAVPLLMAAIGIWLWRKAGVVAAWATGHDLQDEPDEPDAAPAPGEPAAGGGLTVEMLERVALTTLGVWVLVNAIPETCRLLAQALATSDDDSMSSYLAQFNAYWVGGLVAAVIRLFLGFWLLFKTDGIVRLLDRMRRVGLTDDGRE
jgi:hypothetical protein